MVLQRVRQLDTWKICGGVAMPQSCAGRIVDPLPRVVEGRDVRGEIDQDDRPSLLRVRDRVREDTRIGDPWQVENVEDVDVLEREDARLRCA